MDDQAAPAPAPEDPEPQEVEPDEPTKRRRRTGRAEKRLRAITADTKGPGRTFIKMGIVVGGLTVVGLVVVLVIGAMQEKEREKDPLDPFRDPARRAEAEEAITKGANLENTILQ